MDHSGQIGCPQLRTEHLAEPTAVKLRMDHPNPRPPTNSQLRRVIEAAKMVSKRMAEASCILGPMNSHPQRCALLLGMDSFDDEGRDPALGDVGGLWGQVINSGQANPVVAFGDQRILVNF